jgi:hypothetical protein
LREKKVAESVTAPKTPGPRRSTRIALSSEKKVAESVTAPKTPGPRGSTRIALSREKKVAESVTAPKTPGPRRSTRIALSREKKVAELVTAPKTQPIAEARTRSSRARGSTREPLRRSERLAEKALLKKWYVPF